MNGAQPLPTGAQHLAGQRILIVEDDYLLAFDTECILSGAGAEIVGPFATESTAIDAIRQGGIDAAITDINLGLGASFQIAHALRQVEIPFIFLTGYDQTSIPEEFRDVMCLAKPIDTRTIVKELAHVLEAG